MAKHVVIISQFADYQIGQRIEDPSVVDVLLASHRDKVVPIVAPDEPDAPIVEAPVAPFVDDHHE